MNVIGDPSPIYASLIETATDSLLGLGKHGAWKCCLSPAAGRRPPVAGRHDR
tara:strand:+ start:720 stop:875 length:156 start_codon:yes stop_codon:yes gene_type:complete